MMVDNELRDDVIGLIGIGLCLVALVVFCMMLEG